MIQGESIVEFSIEELILLILSIFLIDKYNTYYKHSASYKFFCLEQMLRKIPLS